MIAIGFVVSASATVFLSVDLYKFEDAATEIVNRTIYAIRLQQISDDTLIPTELGQMLRKAENHATRDTAKQTHDKAVDVATTLEHRRGFILAAIVLVVIGGLMGVVGVII